MRLILAVALLIGVLLGNGLSKVVASPPSSPSGFCEKANAESVLLEGAWQENTGEYRGVLVSVSSRGLSKACLESQGAMESDQTRVPTTVDLSIQFINDAEDAETHVCTSLPVVVTGKGKRILFSESMASGSIAHDPFNCLYRALLPHKKLLKSKGLVSNSGEYSSPSSTANEKWYVMEGSVESYSKQEDTPWAIRITFGGASTDGTKKSSGLSLLLEAIPTPEKATQRWNSNQRFCTASSSSTSTQADEKGAMLDLRVSVYNATTTNYMSVYFGGGDGSRKIARGYFPATYDCETLPLTLSWPSSVIGVGYGGRSRNPCRSCISALLTYIAGSGEEVCGVLKRRYNAMGAGENGDAVEIMLTKFSANSLQRIPGIQIEKDHSPRFDLHSSSCAMPSAVTAKQMRTPGVGSSSYCGTYAGTPTVKMTWFSAEEGEEEGGGSGNEVFRAVNISVQTTGFQQSCTDVRFVYEPNTNLAASFQNIRIREAGSVDAKCTHDLMASVGRTPWYALSYHKNLDHFVMTIQTGAFVLSRC